MAAKKAKQPSTQSGDEVFIQDVLGRLEEIAARLRQSTSRTQATQALADVFLADEATQFALIKALARQHDVNAADVLLAMHELAPQKDVRKEARRALIQLAGSKVYPSWAPGSEQPTAIASNYPPRFWKGAVTLMRERGQVRLALSWEYGFEYSEARSLYFMLDFIEHGVGDFLNESGAKRVVDKHYQEQINLWRKDEDGPVEVVDCTLAESKRLLLEALDVNRWRKTTPHKDYRHYLPTVQQLILNAPETGADRGNTFINPDLEPDAVAGTFIGAWSLGDYGLCFDLLSGESAAREGLERYEWVARRCAWADEAHPQYYDPSVIREREQVQSAIWLPGSFAPTRREVDACWSLELADTPLSGTLPEMPLGTAVLRETGRHWFWTGYTLAREDDAWRIQRITDEGANAQGLPLAELERRLKEQQRAITRIMEENKEPPIPLEIGEEVIWRTIYSLYYLDALLVKNPLDTGLYAEAVSRATAIGLSERALVYLQQWAARFPQDAQHVKVLQQIGVAGTFLAVDYRAHGLNERAARFFELAERSLREVLSTRPEPINYVLLAELKVAQGDLDSASDYLRQGLAAGPTPQEEAQIENDLAGISMQRSQPEEALRHYQRIEQLVPDFKNLSFNMGHAHRLLNNLDEAQRYLRRSIEEEPENALAFAELTALYAYRHEYPEAMQVAEEGLRRYPNSATLHGLLATIFYDQKDFKRAEAELSEAERLDPESPNIKALRSQLSEARRR